MKRITINVTVSLLAFACGPDRALEVTKDPASWNITSEGLTFTFDHCEFFACSQGTKQVKIPFTDMKEILNTEMSLLKELGV